jgi:phosphate butyryltransferase
MIKSFIEIPDNEKRIIAAVAGADDLNTILALEKCYKKQNLRSILLGNEDKIKNIFKDNNLDIGKYEIINCNNEEEVCLSSLDLCDSGRANIIIKGMVNSSLFLRYILENNKKNQHTGFISHLWSFENNLTNKLLILTDCALNISPNLEEKAQIIRNAVDFCKILGIKKPNVAVLAPTEQVNPSIQSTIDAACLKVMNDRGQIKDCLVEGPLALDNAVSKEALEKKNINSKFVEGVDIFLVPDINTGNILGKSLNYFAGLRSAPLLWGTRYISVLTSRAHDPETKYNSVKLSIYCANFKNNKNINKI